MKEFILGIDIGGTTIKMGSIHKGKKVRGKIIHRLIVDTPKNANDDLFLDHLKGNIEKLISRFSSQEKLCAIGIGSPGPLDADEGIIFTSSNLNGLKRCSIKKYLGKNFYVPAYLQNDANCAGIGHKYFGLGKRYSNFGVFTLGTGIGGGLVLNDKLFSGYKGNAFEIGHIPIIDQFFQKFDHYVKCGCGSYGCLETYGSATAVTNMYNFFAKKANPKNIKRAKNSKDVLQFAKKNDIIARKVFQIAGRSLGLASAYLLQSLNLSLIIFTGGMAAASSFFAPELEKTLKEKCFDILLSNTKIKYTTGNEDFGILGAASLCLS